MLGGASCAGGDTTSCGLEQESDEVAGNEEVGVGLGTEAGDSSAVDDDDAREAEVDSGGEEGGGNCQADEVSIIIIKRAYKIKGRRNLLKEWSLREGIIMHLHTSDISDDFTDQSTHHGNQISPCLIVDTESDL